MPHVQRHGCFWGETVWKRTICHVKTTKTCKRQRVLEEFSERHTVKAVKPSLLVRPRIKGIYAVTHHICNPVCLKNTEPVWSFFFLCLGVTLFHRLCSVWTQEYETPLPPLHLQHRFAPHPEPSAVCLLILIAQGLVALLLLFTLFFLSLTPPLCLIFSCSLLSPLLPVKFHFTD